MPDLEDEKAQRIVRTVIKLCVVCISVIENKSKLSIEVKQCNKRKAASKKGTLDCHVRLTAPEYLVVRGADASVARPPRQYNLIASHPWQWMQ